MFCPDTKIFREEIAYWNPVVPGEDENGEFIGDPTEEVNPLVTAL